VIANGKGVKQIKQRKKRVLLSSTLSLIAPPIIEAQERSIRFKIVKNGGNVSVGLGRRQELEKTKYGWPSNDEGVYIIRGFNGWVCNHLDSSQDGKKSDFRFSSGDTVEMSYDPKAMELKVDNITKNLRHTLKNINNTKDLHYCVNTRYLNDEVEIVDN